MNDFQNFEATTNLRKGLHLKGFDPSESLIDLDLRWIYTSIICIPCDEGEVLSIEMCNFVLNMELHMPL